jgi:predicted acetyltransferase
MSDFEIQVTPRERSFEHSLQLGEESVSGLSIVDRTMRVGVASVRMGGIAGVWTARQHRGKGYSRRVLEHSNVWMRENGFDCALLFGIDDYYHKFGYAACLPECVVEVATRDAERAASALTARPLTPEDLPAVREIYAENNAALTGSLVRDEQTAWLEKGSDWLRESAVFVFCDLEGAVQAYAAYDVTDDSAPIRDECVVSELGARAPEAYAAIARWAAERALERRVDTIQFLLPPDHPFIAYATRYGAEQKITFPRNGTGMGCLLNLETFFQKTQAEWARRAARHPTLPSDTTLRLETDIGAITLRWTGTAVVAESDTPSESVLRLPQNRLMQMVMGYHSLEMIRLFEEVELSGSPALGLALFPRRLPYMWLADHF